VAEWLEIFAAAVLMWIGVTCKIYFERDTVILGKLALWSVIAFLLLFCAYLVVDLLDAPRVGWGFFIAVAPPGCVFFVSFASLHTNKHYS
jgi:hypothetical protein